MNRHTRRRAEAAKRRVPLDRSDLIGLAHKLVGNSDDPTLTGCTLILPSGETVYIDADDARALAGRAPANGHA